jgi:hypothetical protein
MLEFIRRIGQSRRMPSARRVTPAVRLTVEPLEDRDLLSTVPLPVTGLVATGISSSAIGLHWNASTDPTVTGYDVYSKVWVRTGGPKGSSGGHYAYNLLAAKLTTNSDTVTGLTAGGSTPMS